MRRHAVCLAMLALAALPGCGDNEVTVDVDVLSFVDPEEQGGDYLVPGGLRLPPLTIEPQPVTLLDGLAEVVVMERVDVSFALAFAGAAGSGAGTVEVRLYFADPAAGGGSAVYQTAPVYTGTASLTGGTTATLTGTIEATAANGLLALFQRGGLDFGMALIFDATGSVEPLQGEWDLTRIDAVVLGTGDIF
jgi:hypothetical protein